MSAQVKNEDLHQRRRVSVLLPLPLDGPYDYLVPENVDLPIGSIVEVPLGARHQIGVVWGEAQGDVAAEKLKEISRALPAPPLPEDLRRFVDWVAQYTFSKAGSVLALTLRAREALEAPGMLTYYRLAGPAPARMTAARTRVMEAAQDKMVRRAKDLAQEAGVSTSVVKGLAASGTLETLELPADAPFPEPDVTGVGPKLSAQQEQAAEELKRKVATQDFSVTLLDGVTGSGKTEVYFDAMTEALKGGRQVLVLLPEIALTIQVLDRFTERFGCRPAVWHSGLSQVERRRTYRAIARGEAQVVVGARSALFLPYPNLGLLVVDEEHDSSFKQDEGVVYHARDMAAVRGSLGQFAVILASATPSLETLHNVEQGKYEVVHLPRRHGKAQLPTIEAIDMRREKLPGDRFLSEVLVGALHETLDSGEQGMLFLNRRGYAPLTLCRTCGHRMMSLDSSSWLVEHRFLNRLVCHHSGYWIPKPEVCPECGAKDSLAACGPGVERLAEEVESLFPDARVEIMSSDTMGSARDVQELLTRVEQCEVDLLIGTQVMAKGHNFPQLTLVGVVDGDLGLAGGDLRASERTYQMLHQVAGRAGRAERPGRVLVQTYMPDHAVMAALVAGDRDEFMACESAERELLSMPPHGRLVGILLSGPDLSLVEQTAQTLRANAPSTDQVSLLGPAPAPMPMLRGRHRVRMLLKAGRLMNVQAYLEAWFADVKLPANVRLRVDVDPYSFL